MHGSSLLFGPFSSLKGVKYGQNRRELALATGCGAPADDAGYISLQTFCAKATGSATGSPSVRSAWSYRSEV